MQNCLRMLLFFVEKQMRAAIRDTIVLQNSFESLLERLGTYLHIYMTQEKWRTDMEQNSIKVTLDSH